MHTLGYRFKPWIHKKSIADGASILEYLKETIKENDLMKNILLKHKIVSANWNTEKSIWELKVKEKDEIKNMSCNFLFLCGGYYSYTKPHIPYFKNQEDFNGQIIHPQFWDETINYRNKEIAVIGSGATAMTIVPAIADIAKHVVMIQRSPTYVVSRPSEDMINKFLRKFLPVKISYFLTRWKNILFQSWSFFLARKYPEATKNKLLDMVRDELSEEYDVEKHFTPSYKPWDQRICLVPDSDLFASIRNKKASIVTDTIDKFESDGILLNSGKKIEADIIENGLSEDKEDILFLKKKGFSDKRLAKLSNKTAEEIKDLRNKLQISPIYKRVDSCAGEFDTTTSYMYSCYEN